MSAATIDRYLAPVRARDPLRGKTTTKPSPLLRNSIKIRKAGDEVEEGPGFFEGDTVAHCGPTLRGEFARTVNLTDMRTGWVFTRSVHNNAHVHVLAALDAAIAGIPFEVTGLDFDNGSEFINHDVIGWAAGRKIFFTRGRPYKKNDQATIESKNNHLVRRYGFYWRYDTPEALALLTSCGRWSMTGSTTSRRRKSRSAGAPMQPVAAGASTTGPPPRATGYWPPCALSRPAAGADHLPRQDQPRRPRPPHHHGPRPAHRPGPRRDARPASQPRQASPRHQPQCPSAPHRLTHSFEGILT